MEQAREEGEKPPYGKVGHFSMAVDYGRAVFKEQGQKPQRESHGGQTLENIMETDIGHESTMIPYAAVLKFAYEHTGERRTRPDKLDDVILHVRRLGLGNVHRHTLGSTDIEMRYYVEYFFMPYLMQRYKKSA